MISILKKKFVGDALIYSLNPIVSKVLTFILIPLYTAYLSPADYGNLQYIMLFGAFLRSISQMGLNSAFWKFRSQEGVNKKEIALNLTVNQLGIGVFLLLIYLLLVIAFSELNTILIFIAVYYMALVIKTFSENVMLFSRANFDAKKYLKISILQTVFVFLLNILFVKYMAFNFQGIIYSYLISFTIVALLFYRSLLNSFEGKYNWRVSKEMISYGFPIMIGNIGLMILSLSDRWFIKHFNTDDELGLYAYGYKFADLILVFIIQLFNLAFVPIAWKLQKSAESKQMFSAIRNIIYLLFPLLTFFALGLILMMANLMTSNKAFMEGLNVLAVIAFSHVFYGFYLFHSLGLQFASKTRVLLICNGSAVLINIILNFVLIPDYGAMGASVATFASYLFMLIITIIYSQKYFPLTTHSFRTILHFLAMSAAVFGLTFAYLTYKDDFWMKSLLSFAMALLMVLVLILTSGVSKETIKTLKNIGL